MGHGSEDKWLLYPFICFITVLFLLGFVSRIYS